MQQGRLVELGAAPQVLGAPSHPYTRRLLAAVPNLAPPARAEPQSEARAGRREPEPRPM